MKIAMLIGVLAMVESLCVAAESPSRPAVGAIRWDAWTGGSVTAEVERSLGPEKYHARLPWFAEVVGPDRVRIDGSPQAVMDQEIAFAESAWLDYWAFVLYPEDVALSHSLKSYLKSAARSKVNFCVILHNSFGVPEAQWPKERDRAVALLKEPGYQTVLNGRPLVYAFQVMFKDKFPDERMADFLRAAKAAGLNPYCVYMGWNPASDFRDFSARGFEAVSAYAYNSNAAAFAGLCQAVETEHWRNAAKAGVPYIPLVTTGWDYRPRIDNPVSWQKELASHGQKVFPAIATPQEIASHLDRAIRFVQENKKVCPANAIIIYAWNEHDEGGWLAPTWTPGGKPNAERIEAIGRILKRDSPAARPPVAPTSAPVPITVRPLESERSCVTPVLSEILSTGQQPDDSPNPRDSHALGCVRRRVSYRAPPYRDALRYPCTRIDLTRNGRWAPLSRPRGAAPSPVIPICHRARRRLRGLARVRLQQPAEKWRAADTGASHNRLR